VGILKAAFAKEVANMRTLCTQNVRFIGLVLSIIGTQSCSGLSKDGTADANPEVRTDTVSDLATDNKKGNELDKIEIAQGYVPCPDGELTLEHAMTVMNKQLCNYPYGYCGDASKHDSPQCLCKCCGGGTLREKVWHCYDSEPVSDAY